MRGLFNGAFHMHERIRGRKLQQIRARLFADEPLCRRCAKQGRTRLATQRDHIVALTNGGTDTLENTQPLCDECHLQKTAEDLGKTTRQRIGPDGWPVG